MKECRFVKQGCQRGVVMPRSPYHAGSPLLGSNRPCSADTLLALRVEVADNVFCSSAGNGDDVACRLTFVVAPAAVAESTEEARELVDRVNDVRRV